MQPPRTVGNVRAGQTDDQLQILESEVRILESEVWKREREFNEILRRELLRLQPDTLLSPRPEGISVTNMRTWIIECMRSLQSVTQPSQPSDPLRNSAMLFHAGSSKTDCLNGIGFPKSASFNASARSRIAPGNSWSRESSLYCVARYYFILQLNFTTTAGSARSLIALSPPPFFFRERRCPWR